MQGLLPYRVWLPYDTNVTVIFWIISVQQIVTIIFTTVINVATETLVFGFVLQTCAQLEILGSRLRKLMTNNNAVYRQKDISHSSNAKKSIMSQHIRHHLGIYKLVIHVWIDLLEFVQIYPINQIISKYNITHAWYAILTQNRCSYAKMVNVIYKQVLFIQFFVSVLVLCTSIYYISTHFTETESVTMLIYVFCMFVQIFLYCWSGNEVIVKVKTRTRI